MERFIIARPLQVILHLKLHAEYLQGKHCFRNLQAFDSNLRGFSIAHFASLVSLSYYLLVIAETTLHVRDHWSCFAVGAGC